MVQQLRTVAALPEDSGLCPAPIQQLTLICKFSSKGFRPSSRLQTCTQHTDIHADKTPAYILKKEGNCFVYSIEISECAEMCTVFFTDSIEANVESSEVHVERATDQLQRAAYYQVSQHPRKPLCAVDSLNN